MSVKHVVLVGLPGVGKTTVGRAVATRLQRGFIDLDDYVERAFGKPVGRIFAEDGEAAFRRAEAEATSAAARAAPSIIAPGGGWVLNALATAHLLDSGRIIYLRVSPEAAVRRMGRGIVRRPLLIAAANPYDAMRVLHETREPLYEGYSEIRIETSGMARSTVIATVVESVLAAERDIANTTTNEND